MASHCSEQILAIYYYCRMACLLLQEQFEVVWVVIEDGPVQGCQSTAVYLLEY